LNSSFDSWYIVNTFQDMKQVAAQHGFIVLDIKDPAKPREVSRLTLDGSEGKSQVSRAR